MSSIAQQRTRHANRCRVVVNGVILAEGTNVTANESSNPQGVYVINDVEAQEHVHSQLNARVTIGKLVWRGSALRQLKVGADLTGLPTFDVQCMDDIDGEVLFVARTCTVADRGMTVSANQPINTNISLAAIRLEDGSVGVGRATNAPGGAGGQQPTP